MKIHILGGGIGGMSAALHAARIAADQAGPPVQIIIYEGSDRLGGKASSQFDHGPGEHGFRFFPNFYRCIVDTMNYIPITGDQVGRRKLRPELEDQTVRELIVETGHAGVARDEKVHEITRAASLKDMPELMHSSLGVFGVSSTDVLKFTAELIRFLVVCPERALEEWEDKTLNGFMEKHDFSAEMVVFLQSLRALSAMRADGGSLRTLLSTATQMVADFDKEYETWDGILPGPTDYLFIEPWEAELKRLGVEWKFQSKVTALNFDEAQSGVATRLASVDFLDGNHIDASNEDLFVLALPFEVARPLLVEGGEVPAEFAGLLEIKQSEDNLNGGSEPMVGIQYFMRRSVPLTNGHVMYPESHWSMTSISQGQFWEKTFTEPLEDVFAMPGLKDVLSVIVSAWDVVAPRIGLAADGSHDETKRFEQIAKEAFAQVIEGAGSGLSWADVIDFNVDQDIHPRNGRAHCTTPLWVSPKGSFLNRPEADAGCANLFVASDWARTETDVGSMESADEAARLALQALLPRIWPHLQGSDVLPQVRPLRIWKVVELARAADKWLYDRGYPNPLTIHRSAIRSLFDTLLGLQGPDQSAQENEEIARVMRYLQTFESDNEFVDSVPLASNDEWLKKLTTLADES